MKYSLIILLLGIHVSFALPEAGQDQGDNSSKIISGEDEITHFKEIEPVLMEKYFSRKPLQYLVDPQRFLSSEEGKSIETFLNHHAADSTIDLYLFIFGEDQKLPDEGENKDFMQRHFSKGKPVIVLYYYFGNPTRSGIDICPLIAKDVSPSERERSLQGSLIRATRENGFYEQLEEFVMQFSVHTYWMERMLDEASVIAVGESFVEVPPMVVEMKRKSNPLEWIPEQFRESVLIGVGGLVSLLFLSALLLWLRSRMRLKFPEIELEMRLGGSHGAGIGAVVHFGSPAVSPARQREQVPEYLRRA